MSENTRIMKDIDLFEKNIGKVTGLNTQPVELAQQYCTDARYYLEKKDYFTAFGCINYAHGLLDAVRMLSQTL